MVRSAAAGGGDTSAGLRIAHRAAGAESCSTRILRRPGCGAAVRRLPQRCIIPATTDSPTGKPGSTMGARRLNFCVRNGNRWNPPAIVTGMRQRCRLFLWSGARGRCGEPGAGCALEINCGVCRGGELQAAGGPWRGAGGRRDAAWVCAGACGPLVCGGRPEIEVKPHGHLVRVSCTCCQASTSRLSSRLSS